jgi:CRP-like cAMP-binding protein
MSPVDKLSAIGVAQVLRIDPRNPTHVAFQSQGGIAIVRSGLGRLEDGDGHLRGYRGPATIVHAEDYIIGDQPSCHLTALTREVELVIIPLSSFARQLDVEPALKTRVLKQVLRDRENHQRFDLARRLLTAAAGLASPFRWRAIVAAYLLEALDALSLPLETPAAYTLYEHLRRQRAPREWFALPIPRISRDLAVSSPPVREGLQRLEADKAIARDGGMLRVERPSILVDAAQTPAGEVDGLDR